MSTISGRIFICSELQDPLYKIAKSLEKSDYSFLLDQAQFYYHIYKTQRVANYYMNSQYNSIEATAGLIQYIRKEIASFGIKGHWLLFGFTKRSGTDNVDFYLCFDGVSSFWTGTIFDASSKNNHDGVRDENTYLLDEVYQQINCTSGLKKLPCLNWVDYLFHHDYAYWLYSNSFKGFEEIYNWYNEGNNAYDQFIESLKDNIAFLRYNIQEFTEDVNVAYCRNIFESISNSKTCLKCHKYIYQIQLTSSVQAYCDGQVNLFS